MSDQQNPRYVTANEFNKLVFYRQRLNAILKRDGTFDQFKGSIDYLLRSVIEALEMQNIFYDAPGDKLEEVLINDTPLDWNKAKGYFDRVVKQYESLRGMPGVNVTIALTHVFAPLRRRYDEGERTAALYEEMMSVE